MPGVLHSREVCLHGGLEVRVSGRGVSGDVAVVPIAWWERRKDGSEGWSEAHVVGFVGAGGDREILDVFSTYQEPQVALDTCVDACMQQLNVLRWRCHC